MRLLGPLLALALATPLLAQSQTLPLWPRGTPEPPQTSEPEHDITETSDGLVAGKPLQHLTDVSQPTLTLYPAPHPSGAAVLVFPGGSYRILAYDLEGTEVCSWLNSLNITCALIKYRVPETGRFPTNTADLEDAQQAMRLTRAHAADWRLDPHRIGVLGFSAGAHLAATLATHPGFLKPGPPNAQVDTSVNARPDFALIVYPGYLTNTPALNTLDAALTPSASTPPTFLLQAEDDPVHVENVLVYFRALKDAKVPAELHIFAEGGHGYGLRPTDLPITHWPNLAATWLHTIHILPPNP